MGVTSGNFITSDSGRGDANFYGRMIFEWWETGSGISGSLGYHNISYHLKTFGGSSGFYQYFNNGSMNVDGAGYSWGQTKLFGNGAGVLGDYYNTLFTNAVGQRTFGASAQGAIFATSGINTSGSNGWTLNDINLWGGVDYITVPSPLTDESSNIVVGWHHYTGTPHLWFRLDQIDNTDATYHIVNPSNPYTWSGFQSWLQAKMVNTNTSVLYIYYGDDIDSNGSVDNWQGPWTYTVSIANDTGQANPTFSNFTYLDTNTTTAAITGNNQVLIQGKSTLQTTVTTGNKATANKQAVMVNYTDTIGGYSGVSGWSAIASVVQNISTINDVSGVQNLSIRATDSRSNSKTVTKPVTILPYASPAIDKLVTIGYTNNFDYQDGLTVTANGTTIAEISPMTLSGSDKNSVAATHALQFDVSKGNNSSYTGTWTDITVARTAGSPNVTTNLATLGSAILTKMGTLTFDNSIKWYVKFKIVDVLETQTFETSIDIGKAIFRIGTDNKLYNKEEQVMILPMVSVLADTKASGIAGGTGTVTPYIIAPVYVKYGTGIGNSSTVIFDISFDFTSSSAGMRTWAFKVDGNAIGSSARQAFIQTANARWTVHQQIVATGLAVGTHTVQIEIYGSGNNVSADAASFCTVVATEWANVHTPDSTGAKYAGTVVDGGGAGAAWSNPSNAQGVENGTVATVTEGVTAGAANALKSSAHGFSVPSTATITGIRLEALVYGTTFDSVIDVGTSTKRSTSTPFSSALGGWGLGGVLNWVTWGSNGDLWGRTDWAPVDINSSTFGAGLLPAAHVTSSADQVDAIRITVYYV